MSDQVEPLINEIFTGLVSGITQFAGPTRCALALARKESSSLQICDPDNLLRDQYKTIQSVLTNDDWRVRASVIHDKLGDGSLTNSIHFPVPIGPLLPVEAFSSKLFYQVWFAEIHTRIGSPEPIKEWLILAAGQLFVDSISTDWAISSFDTISPQLADFAPEALRRCTARRIKLSTQFNPIKIIANLSTALEESRKATGNIIFLGPDIPQARRPRFISQFAEPNPKIEDIKFMRKTLTSVEGCDAMITCDLTRALGICQDERIPGTLKAEFRNGRGQLYLGDDFLCSIFNGTFRSAIPKPDLTIFDELLKTYLKQRDAIEPLNKAIRTLVDAAFTGTYGCTLLIDLGSNAILTGQKLVSPLDLTVHANAEIATAMSRIDGALHLTPKASLLAFGCLLDGYTTSSELISRGARYNSALRYSQKEHNTIVLIVSADGPVACFHKGLDLMHHTPLTSPQPRPVTLTDLRDWVKTV